MMPPQPPATSPASVHRPPLAGVTVLDLTRLLPGPVAGMHLADLGANVIKIEDTGAGDYAAEPVRSLVNRNKRGIRLNLKTPAGVQALLDLCATADILIEGFRPGVMARLGVDYEAARSRNPAIVYCSISGYGQTGPLRDEPGHDLNYCSLAGVADQLGSSGVAPGLSNVPMADLLGGSMVSVMGILSALFDAARTGQGRYVDIAIADGILAHAMLPLAAVNQNGKAPPTGGAKLTGALPCYALYATRDGRYLAVAALEKKFWAAFCQAAGRHDLIDLHRTYEDPGNAWVRHQLEQLIAAQDLAWWRDKLQGTQCCVTPVMHLHEVLDHAHFESRGMIRIAAGTAQLGCPVRMSGFRFDIRLPAPAPGEHTDEVLGGLGYGAGKIEALRKAGAAG
ncbi:CaiB/BaiF CoA transferase family protein [Bordetella petrii]|uniref:CaiB/BaiF CoA transferase family protein n=1 Tax=Bordetella petrii TaxID=94624 RepID=UPI001E4A15AD|nr:CaiB/BaiF CoA-transferase family protein [Bordetella petrii]MCD0502511.1 CoA transferase [Bordetella petrii]